MIVRGTDSLPFNAELTLAKVGKDNLDNFIPTKGHFVQMVCSSDTGMHAHPHNCLPGWLLTELMKINTNECRVKFNFRFEIPLSSI